MLGENGDHLWTQQGHNHKTAKTRRRRIVQMLAPWWRGCLGFLAVFPPLYAESAGIILNCDGNPVLWDLNCAGAPFMKLNGKSQFKLENVVGNC